MKIVLIGAVSSSLRILNKLIEHGFNLVGVFGYEPDKKENISGWVNMSDICKTNNISYFPFTLINDPANVEILNSIKPNLIFAVGFSQLISEEILSIPNLGCIGFHPTALPKGRGRAPIPWMILNENAGAANFFLMGKGTDDGPVFIQKFFEISSSDNAKSVQLKLYNAIDQALDKWLPELKIGIWNPIPQDHNLATFYGKRAPLDGWINWEKNSESIDVLIRATSKPYPGAYTFYKDAKLIIWKSHVELELKITGVVGRILLINRNNLLIQTGNGLIWIEEYELEDFQGKTIPLVDFKIGEKLGYNIEYEIFKLKNILKK